MLTRITGSTDNFIITSNALSEPAYEKLGNSRKQHQLVTSHERSSQHLVVLDRKRSETTKETLEEKIGVSTTGVGIDNAWNVLRIRIE